MRILDIIMAVPGIAMAAVTVLVFGRTLTKSGNTAGLVVIIICSIAFVYIPQLSRIVRANVMAAYGEDYVRAVIVSGARAPGSSSSTSCATPPPRSSCSRPSLSPTRHPRRPP